MHLPLTRRTRRLLAGLVGVLAVRTALASWHRQWLATPDETLRPLPGDDIVPDASVVRTHGVTVDAPARAVWPWLVEMGADKAGWYRHGRLDDDRAAGTREFVSDLQDLSVGDVVPALPGADAGFVVSVLDPGRSLVLASRTDLRRRRAAAPNESPRWVWETTWAFDLREATPDRTRLVVRVRVAYAPRLLAPLAHLVAPPVLFLRQRRQLLGIKSRAEALTRRDDGEDDERERQV
jgi:hypothetical protein